MVKWFLLLTATIGIIVALNGFNWVLLWLIGLLLLPAGILGLVFYVGESFWTALWQVFLGIALMQGTFILSGWAAGAWRRRGQMVPEHDRGPPKIGEN